jgi:hypothetical protein
VTAGERRFGPWRSEARAFIELFALCGIAVVQPLLDILSKNTGLFVTRGTTPFEAVLLVLLVVFVPPLVLWAIEVVVGLVLPRARRWAHAALAALVVGVIVVEVVKKQTSLGAVALLVLGAALGVGAGLLVLRVGAVRQFLRYLAIAPVVFAVLFLAFSPVTDVVFSSASGSTRNVGISDPKRIMMVVFDEFPEGSLLDGSGHIDAELFPNFAALADDGTWYRNETTVAPYTELAVPAILTGQYPHDADALPTVTDYPDNLFTLLGKGYDMNVHEIVTQLCPQRVCTGDHAGATFGGLVEQSARLWRDFASPSRSDFSFSEFEGTKIAMESAKRFIASIEPSSRPRLDFAHVELPHQPWHYLGSLQDTGATGQLQGAKYLQWSDPTAAGIARQRHLLQVQATDTLLGQMLDALKATGEYDDTLVVVTADHGVAFDDGEPLRSASEENYDEIMWPPLFVKYPGQVAGEVDDRPAESVDILPTIAEEIGAEVPWDLDGRSLRGEARPEGPRRLYQYAITAYEAPDVLHPPEGKAYLEFDGADGFEKVLEARAAPPGGDPRLRIYRSGEFGFLVGEESAPLVRDVEGSESVTFVDAAEFERVAPKAKNVPWVYSEAFLNGLDRAAPVALVIDGRIVSVSQSLLLANDGGGFVMMLVSPDLVTPGSKQLEVYLVRGTPDAPTLDPIEFRG